MGELKNCASCGKIFVKITRNICPDCVENEEQEFIRVRDYIKNNSQPIVEEIAEETQVDEKKILRWMREGRLEYSSEGTISGLTCKRCGIGIKIGEYCPSCVKKMVDQLSAKNPGINKNEAVPTQNSKREGMFVANRLRKDD